MKRRLLAAVVGLGALLPGVPCLAQPSPWKVAEPSEIIFRARITGSSFEGRSKAIGGSVTYDATAGELTGGELVVATDSFKTGMELRDRHMRERYLQAKRFPTIVLLLDPAHIAAKAMAQNTVRGKFTIRGITRPTKANVTVTSAGDEILLISATLKLTLTDYDIPQPRFAVIRMETGLDVTVTLTLTPAG